jgi:4-hydroxy-3-methylbut-2-enyl diphosphate reductase
MSDVMRREILLAQPRGFCAGVERAIEIVEKAIEKFGAPIYVRHEIVHNTYVVNDLKQKGAVFIEDINEVPMGATLIFSDHGVPKVVERQAQDRELSVYDATCPLVTKVHIELTKLAEQGYEFIMIGHKGHPEVEGTLGQLDKGIHLVENLEDINRLMPSQTELLAVVTQTTLSVDDTAEIVSAIKMRFPKVRMPKQQDICYATQNRQDAVKMMSAEVDIVIVVGSHNSSNSNRLRDLAIKQGRQSFMVDSVADIDESWFEGHRCIGVTAGASAPEVLVQEVISKLKKLGALSVRQLKGVEEKFKFPLPKGLKVH